MEDSKISKKSLNFRRTLWQRERWPLSMAFGILSLCCICKTEAGKPSLMDLQLCPQLMYELFKNCSKNIGLPITRTSDPDCCRLAMQANAAGCYCDNTILQTGQQAGLTPSAIQTSLVLYCAVKPQDLHILTIGGCVPEPSPPPQVLAPPTNRCRNLTDSFFQSCNSTSVPDCCRLTTQANADGCYCDPDVLDVGRAISMTPTALQYSLTYCGVPPKDVNVLSIAGCGAAPVAAPATPAPGLSTQVTFCQELTFTLFKDCTVDNGGPTRHIISTPDCCQQIMKANDALCFCDPATVVAAEEVGFTVSGFGDFVMQECNVPRQSLNVLNYSGCAAAQPPPDQTPVLNQAGCWQLALTMQAKCHQSALEATDTTLAADCCRLSKQANNNWCYCDPTLIAGAEAIGVTSMSIKASLTLFCNVPVGALHILNVTGCTGPRPESFAPSALPGPLGSPVPGKTSLAQDTAPPGNTNPAPSKRGMLGPQIATATTLLAIVILA